MSDNVEYHPPCPCCGFTQNDRDDAGAFPYMRDEVKRQQKQIEKLEQLLNRAGSYIGSEAETSPTRFAFDLYYEIRATLKASKCKSEFLTRLSVLESRVTEALEELNRSVTVSHEYDTYTSPTAEERLMRIREILTGIEGLVADNSK